MVVGHPRFHPPHHSKSKSHTTHQSAISNNQQAHTSPQLQQLGSRFFSNRKMQRALFLITLSFLLDLSRGVPLPEANSTLPAERVCPDGEGAAAMDSESNRRMLFMQRRYISYGTLRRDSVPCNRPGASYYSCGTPGVSNAYTRGCQIITRCARSD